MLAAIGAAFSFAKNLTIPWWAWVTAIAGLLAAFAAWNRVQQHEIDAGSFDRLEAQYKEFRDQVATIGEAARKARDLTEAKQKADLLQLESDHAKREKDLNTRADASDRRARAALSALRLRSPSSSGSPGSGSMPGSSTPTEGVGGVECYRAEQLDGGIRSGLGAAASGFAGVLRRGETAEALVALCEAYINKVQESAPLGVLR